MGPLIRALARHKIVVILIVFEISACFALTANGAALIFSKIGPMDQVILPPDPESLYIVSPGEPDEPLTLEQAKTLAQQDIAALSRVPGTTLVGQINSTPVGGQMQTVSLSTLPQQQVPSAQGVAVYRGTLGALRALKLDVYEGRSLGIDDVSPYSNESEAILGPSVVITESLKTRLFGNGSATGRALFYGETGTQRAVVVGVARDISKPVLEGGATAKFSVLRLADPFADGVYLVRSERNDAVFLDSIREALSAVASNRAPATVESLKTSVNDYFKYEIALADLLFVVLSVIVAVCIMGVSGITSYWIKQRYRAIGIRRALGASVHQIFIHFALESAIVSATGVLLGVLGYFGSSSILVAKFGLPNLELQHLILLCLAFEVVCLASVVRSVMTASRLSPIEAVRL